MRIQASEHQDSGNLAPQDGVVNPNPSAMTEPDRASILASARLIGHGKKYGMFPLLRILYSRQNLDRYTEPVVLKLVDPHDSAREGPMNRAARLEIAGHVHVCTDGVVSRRGREVQSVRRKIDGRAVFRRQFRIEWADANNLLEGRSLASPLLLVFA